MSQITLRNQSTLAQQNPMMGQALQDVVTQLSQALAKIAVLEAQVAALNKKVGI